MTQRSASANRCRPPIQPDAGDDSKTAASQKACAPAWHTVFLRMLPAIRQHARFRFRHLDPESREECIQEVLCNVCCAVARLAELNKLDRCHASAMARFAVAQVKDGRRVGGRLNCEDISSLYCQRRKGVVIERLYHFHVEENAWEEIVVEDRNATPAEVAHHAELGRQRDVLESERREIGKQRRSESLLAPVMERFWPSAGGGLGAWLLLVAADGSPSGRRAGIHGRGQRIAPLARA
jgi:hypothetical protein